MSRLNCSDETYITTDPESIKRATNAARQMAKSEFKEYDVEQPNVTASITEASTHKGALKLTIVAKWKDRTIDEYELLHPTYTGLAALVEELVDMIMVHYENDEEDLDSARKPNKNAQRADLINWLHHIIDINEPDLTDEPTDIEIEIPVEIDDQTTWDLIKTNIRDRGMRFKVDYTDKTQDTHYYYMYIWNQDNLDSNRKGANTMLRKTLKMNCANGTFDEKAFNKYISELADDALEYINAQGDDAQTMEKKFPGYNSDWCPAEYSVPMNRIANKIRDLVLDYYKEVYLGDK